MAHVGCVCDNHGGQREECLYIDGEKLVHAACGAKAGVRRVQLVKIAMWHLSRSIAARSLSVQQFDL